MTGLIAAIDDSGLYGAYAHYVFIGALVGSTLLLFIYFWYKGRLDMDEEPKFQMMKEEDEDDVDPRRRD